MIELKFRAWHEADKCWYNPRFIEMNLLGQAILSHGIEQFEIIPASAIEQYTGLKDKNGKEIYEGDIVKVDDGEDVADCRKFLGDNATVVRSISKAGAFVAKNWYGEQILNWDISLSRIEVIGNIHENKELLD